MNRINTLFTAGAVFTVAGIAAAFLVYFLAHVLAMLAVVVLS